jgi:hypothetical protein
MALQFVGCKLLVDATKYASFVKAKIFLLHPETSVVSKKTTIALV